MNYEEIKRHSIRTYLATRGIFPQWERGNRGMYLSPLREERTASFIVSYDKNLWHDFGTGEGGSIIDLVARMENCSDIEAARRLNERNVDTLVPVFVEPPRLKKTTLSRLVVLSDRELIHPALLGYLTGRGIDPAIARTYCREVYYTISGKMYFAIGFRNDAGGWELRNSRFKGSSTPKNITTLDNGSNTAMVFEGFIDFLSYLSMKANPTPSIDTVVFNSVTNLQKAVPFLVRHRVVHAFLDNDEAGRKAVDRLGENLPSSEVIDQSVFYRDYKDLNDYWQEKRKTICKVIGDTPAPAHEKQWEKTKRADISAPETRQCVQPSVKKKRPVHKF